MVWVIVGLALALLGGLLIFVLQMPEASAKKKKKKAEPAPEPVKDWQAIAQRLEKRIQTLEGALQAAQNEVKARDKKMLQLEKVASDARRQSEQELLWRQKEEALIAKDKKQEKILQEELHKTRTELNAESTLRIKQDYELKELRQLREEQSAGIRKLSSQNIDLDRKLAAALAEGKDLRQENGELRKKKEDEEWVAKSDYKRLESILKRARWELEQFKRKFSSEEWPKPLQPKTATASGTPKEADAATTPVVKNDEQGVL